MSNSTRIKYLALMVVAIAVAMGTARSEPTDARDLTLSLSRLEIASGERVMGFEFRIKSARIVAVRDIPVGWNVRIENNPSWNAVIRGSSLVGAAAVDATFFKDFIVIERNESLGLPFDVSGDIVVTRDFTKERRIRISTKDATLVPVEPE